MVRGALEEIYNADTHKFTQKRPIIGYYATGKEAERALAEYNKDPYDVDLRKLTFAEVYQMFYTAKYEHSKKQYSLSTKQSTTSAFKNCHAIHDSIFADLKKPHLQHVVDNCPLKHASLELIVSLFKQMYRYAIENDITDKDYSQTVSINIPDDDEIGVPFFEDELRVLWSNRDKPYVDTILIMIYSGFRIAAFKDIQVNLEERYFQGGVKTNAGKNRIVPIHPAIYDLVAAYHGDTWLTTTYPVYRKKFYSALDELNLLTSTNGSKHTPHDCRHTFSWLCDKYGVNELSKHKLMGHAIKGDVETSVYGHRTIEELRTEIEKIDLPR